MQEFEASGERVVHGCLELAGTLASFVDDGHGEVLMFHLPNRALDMDDGWGTQKTLFASVRLLRDRCVQADNSRHGHDACRVLGDVVAYDASNFVMGVGRVWGLELALGRGPLVATRLSMAANACGWRLTCGAVPDDGPAMAWLASREDAFGVLQGEGWPLRGAAAGEGLDRMDWMETDGSEGGGG